MSARKPTRPAPAAPHAPRMYPQGWIRSIRFVPWVYLRRCIGLKEAAKVLGVKVSEMMPLIRAGELLAFRFPYGEPVRVQLAAVEQLRDHRRAAKQQRLAESEAAADHQRFVQGLLDSYNRAHPPRGPSRRQLASAAKEYGCSVGQLKQLVEEGKVALMRLGPGVFAVPASRLKGDTPA